MRKAIEVMSLVFTGLFVGAFVPVFVEFVFVVMCEANHITIQPDADYFVMFVKIFGGIGLLFGVALGLDELRS